jgi:cellobiose-specific phosphotransferase system component IIC
MRHMFWVASLVGLWLIAAPFALGYSGTFQAAANDVVLRVLIAASSLWMALKADAAWWCNRALVLFGILAIVAPFGLGYSSTTNAMTNDLAAGLIVLALAIVREVFTGRRQRLSHA